MKKLTKAQSAALLDLYRRDLRTVASNCVYEIEQETTLPMDYKTPSWKNFVDCRRQVRMMRDTAMIFWRRMWIGIEPDGHRHS